MDVIATVHRTVKSLHNGKRYGRQWSRIRAQFLADHPVCYCDQVRYWDGRRYRKAAIATGPAPAALVDHIRPLNRGGTHARTNLQALCLCCHATKTRRWG